MTFPHYLQLDAMDCGATCLRMIAKYYGKSYTSQTLRTKTYITREGVSLLGISDAAESIGMRTMGVKSSLEKLVAEDVTPFIAHWRQEHFVVVYGFKKTKSSSKESESVTQSHTLTKFNGKVLVADPAEGKIEYTAEELPTPSTSPKHQNSVINATCPEYRDYHNLSRISGLSQPVPNIGIVALSHCRIAALSHYRIIALPCQSNIYVNKIAE